MSNEQSGASISAVHRQPSIDLAGAVAALVEVFESGRVKLLSDDETGGLIVNTHAVLGELRNTKGYQACRETGFVRDLPSNLKRYATARVGGRIVDGSDAQLTDGIRKLGRIVSNELAELIGKGFNPADLIVSECVKSLEKSAKSLGIKIKKEIGQSSIRPVVFTDFGKAGEVADSDVARVIAAVEDVRGDAEVWGGELANAMRKEGEKRNIPDDELDPVLDDYVRQASMPGSQLNTFLNFLEDEAMARVRLAVGFKIMEAIAKRARSKIDKAEEPEKTRLGLLIRYIERASGIQARVLSPSEEEITVGLSSRFDVQDFNLDTELCKASFYGCLPIWPDAQAQMFERRGNFDGLGPSVSREVGYRFRINGVDPETGKTAFESRLAKIRERLLGDSNGTVSARTVAELVYLRSVISFDEDRSADYVSSVRDTIDRLKREGRPGAVELLSEMESRVETVIQIARACVSILRESGSCVPESLRSRPLTFFLSIRKNIVDWSRAFTEGTREPLVGLVGDIGAKAEWLRRLDVSENPNPMALLSIQARANLAEHRLAVSGPVFNLTVNRELPGGVVQVVWRPTELKTIKIEKWEFPARVEVHYEDKWQGTREKLNEQQENGMAIFRTAFSVLAHVALVTILRAVGDGRTPSVLMLRFQTGGAEADFYSGGQFLYAVGQSVEHALGRDWSVRAQGLVDTDGKGNLRYRERNALGALYSGFPLIVGCRSSGTVEKFGAVVFTSRPCDEYPGIDPEQAGSVCIGKSYLAEKVEVAGKPAYRLSCAAHLLETGFGAAVFEKPPLVMEAVKRLYDGGCRHIVLLAHRFGGRRLGRSAIRHRHHESPVFLNDAASRFPDLRLFPMTRDVFPAVRLRKRGNNEHAFEIVGPSNHVPGGTPVREGQGMIPVYTLATLRYVGKDDASKPQSGFSTYFFIKDDPGLEFFEWREKTSASLFGDDPSVRDGLVSLLRGIHYLESEIPALDGNASPVLDPYQWMSPVSSGGVGDIIIRKKTGGAGQVVLSLPAVLARIHTILDLERGRGVK